MSKTETETEWTKKICDGLKALNCEVYPLIGGARTPGGATTLSGWPDRLVWHIKWHGLLEFKGQHTRLRTDQKIILGRLRGRQPQCAFVCRRGHDDDCGTLEDEHGKTIEHWNGGARGLLATLAALSERDRE